MADPHSSLPFDAAEMDLIRDAFNGTLLLPQGVLTPWSVGDPNFMRAEILDEVSEAIRLFGLDRKWGVDAHVLLSKIAQLTPVQADELHALVTAFWDNAPYCPPAQGITIMDALLGLYEPGEGGAIVRAATQFTPTYEIVDEPPQATYDGEGSSGEDIDS